MTYYSLHVFSFLKSNKKSLQIMAKKLFKERTFEEIMYFLLQSFTYYKIMAVK